MGMSVVRLLGIDQVQKELKLTDEQRAEIAKLREQGRAGRGGNREFFEGLRDLSQEARQKKMREFWKQQQEEADKRGKEAMAKLRNILKSEQLKRANQIQLQLEGPSALRRAAVMEHIGLTEDQKAELNKLQEEIRNDMQGRPMGRGEGSRDEIRQRMQEMRKKMEETQKKAMAVLTAEQKQKLAEMMGEPFELDRSAMRQGRRGGGRDEGRRGEGRRGGGNPPE